MKYIRHLHLVTQEARAEKANFCVRPYGTFLLPKPRKDFGVSLGQALQERRSVRSIAGNREPSPQVLSEVLWSAYGVNRPATGDRTSPSWYHVNELEIFALMSDGVWSYQPADHSLRLHADADVRETAEVQDVGAEAPLHLIYVGNRTFLQGLSSTEQYRVACTHAGFVGQNVSLYCASEGLASVFRVFFDTTPLSNAMRLSRNQFIAFGQAVGYPDPDF